MSTRPVGRPLLELGPEIMTGVHRDWPVLRSRKRDSLDDDRVLSIRDTAALLGIDHMTTFEAEKSAMEKCRAWLARMGITHADLR